MIVDYSSSEDDSDVTRENQTVVSSNTIAEIKQVHDVSPKRHDTSTSKDFRKRKLSPSSDKFQKTKKQFEHESSALPPPSGILSMFAEQERQDITDDPSIHNGRIRSFAHERGNWASLVCISLTHGKELVGELSDLLQDQLQSVGQFHIIDEPHISLSKTFVLRHHWIEPFVSDIRRRLALCHNGTVRLTKLEPYCNDEGSRTFLGLKAVSAGNLLESFISAVDSSLAEYQLPLYYENPSFHVSLVWCLGDVRTKLSTVVLTALQEVVDRYFDENLDASFLEVNEITVKIGNKIFTIPVNK